MQERNELNATASDRENIPGLPPRNAEEAAAARAAAAWTPTAASPVPVLEGPGPVRIDEDAADPGPQPREPLFYITRDGVETEYTIPVVAPDYIWLNFLAITATRGVGVAEVYIVQEMLGPAGWQALISSKAMKRAHYRRMVTVVRDKVAGPEERDPNR
jgi:hypothetical protein